MLKYRAARIGALLAAAWLALAPAGAGAAGASWEQWQSVKGIVDVDGPRSDGTLLIAGSTSLFLVDSNGTPTPFATGPGGYHDMRTGEPYVAVSHGGTVSATGCAFTPDETFILRLRVPLGLIRISADGQDSGSFANLVGATTIDGLAFDNTGSFDHRLLVIGPSGSKTIVFAVDCAGTVMVITRSGPTVEGGLAVAPSTFGGFAGDLIAPDEVTGRIYAIAPDGTPTVIARPGLQVGGDIGVESLGFVPPGFFSRGGFAYYSDRLSAGSAYPGTDSLLRLSSSDLGALGVQEGDMLVATEGGAAMVAVRCSAACTVIPVITTLTKAHGEGHIAFTVIPPPAAPSLSPVGADTHGPLVQPGFVDFLGTWGIPIGVAVVLLAVVVGFAVRAMRRRAR